MFSGVLCQDKSALCAPLTYNLSICALFLCKRYQNCYHKWESLAFWAREAEVTLRQGQCLTSGLIRASLARGAVCSACPVQMGDGAC